MSWGPVSSTSLNQYNFSVSDLWDVFFFLAGVLGFMDLMSLWTWLRSAPASCLWFLGWRRWWRWRWRRKQKRTARKFQRWLEDSGKDQSHYRRGCFSHGEERQKRVHIFRIDNVDAGSTCCVCSFTKPLRLILGCSYVWKMQSEKGFLLCQSPINFFFCSASIVLLAYWKRGL